MSAAVRPCRPSAAALAGSPTTARCRGTTCRPFGVGARRTTCRPFVGGGRRRRRARRMTCHPFGGGGRRLRPRRPTSRPFGDTADARRRRRTPRTRRRAPRTRRRAPPPTDGPRTPRTRRRAPPPTDAPRRQRRRRGARHRRCASAHGPPTCAPPSAHARRPSAGLRRARSGAHVLGRSSAARPRRRPAGYLRRTRRRRRHLRSACDACQGLGAQLLPASRHQQLQDRGRPQDRGHYRLQFGSGLRRSAWRSAWRRRRRPEGVAAAVQGDGDGHGGTRADMLHRPLCPWASHDMTCSRCKRFSRRCENVMGCTIYTQRPTCSYFKSLH